mmetsp:Transcript_26068/g.52272  ORF Transcript_26068/g.52272 Transcript_26068/m.52272 type:complete len:232 (-) Transcript_26068:661-1356(-)
MQMIFASGWNLAISRAVFPVVESTTIALAPMSQAVLTAVEAVDASCERLFTPVSSALCLASFMVFTMDSYPLGSRSLSSPSASMHVRAMISTASLGKLPLAVSPESITQSAPSSTAFATSEHSARVGRGFVIIDSSICVATTHGLPTLRHLRIMFFCSWKTCSGGISMPRSPRATITPSVAARISSKLSRPSWFSILAMIFMYLPSSPSVSRMKAMSAADWTNEAAMKSTW